MSKSLKSRDYLMKCLLFVLLFGVISLGAIGGCNNNGGGQGNEGGDGVVTTVAECEGNPKDSDYLTSDVFKCAVCNGENKYCCPQKLNTDPPFTDTACNDMPFVCNEFQGDLCLEPPPPDYSSAGPDKAPFCMGDAESDCSSCGPSQPYCVPRPTVQCTPTGDPQCGTALTAPSGHLAPICQYEQNICEVRPPPDPAKTRKTTFINNCDETIWVGARTNTLSGGFELPESCENATDCQQACTDVMGMISAPDHNFEIENPQCICNNDKKCQISMKYPVLLDPDMTGGTLSGRFWPRTGCTFGADGNCPKAGDGTGRDYDCCDTGGCSSADGFGLQCNGSSGVNAMIAEFTFQEGIGQVDFYDPSVINGFNVLVEFAADCSTPGGGKPCGDVPTNTSPAYWCGNPGSPTPVTGVEACSSGLFNQKCLEESGVPCESDAECYCSTSGVPCESDAQCFCGGNRDMLIAGISTCTEDSDCVSGFCNVSDGAVAGGGVCVCQDVGDCGDGEICGVMNNLFVGFKACGPFAGCTTATNLCGQYVGKGISGETCGQEECASKICTADFQPVPACTTHDDCSNEALCDIGPTGAKECVCKPNVCDADGKCTNTRDDCSLEEPCTPTICTGTCTASPVDNLNCNQQYPQPLSCTTDLDCPVLIGINCETDEDCPLDSMNNHLECVPLNGSGNPQPGEPAPGKSCRERCAPSGDFCLGPHCTTNNDCLFLDGDGTGTGNFMLCNQDSGSDTFETCVSTNASLISAAGVNGQSCYITYYSNRSDTQCSDDNDCSGLQPGSWKCDMNADPKVCFLPGTQPSTQCGGCPTSFGALPALDAWIGLPLHPGEECLNNNPAWRSYAEDLLSYAKEACPPSYSFQFDDPTSTFTCSDANNPNGRNEVGYTFTFCPSQP